MNIERLLGQGPNQIVALGVGVERHVADAVWLLFDTRSAVQFFDSENDGDGDGNPDGASTFAAASVELGARWFVVDTGLIRPSLRGAASLFGNSFDTEANGINQYIAGAGARGGVDVDVFFLDAVSLRVGTNLVHANFTRGIPNRLDAGTTSVDVGVAFDPTIAVQVYF